MAALGADGEQGKMQGRLTLGLLAVLNDAPSVEAG